ncbi:fused MFS/spermidine synthase [Massilia sp. Root335]|uniref:fused MFS/spermidine synthase n=1 Tax=Massilia sp. Root335 TaxID=1736517 RepID=UPI0006FCE547|nr:fused MFS/spermidine synthase [Massilia sp. Root335]KQV30542.1 transferase spermidine synthase [Massilia sp. Root335]
MPHRDDPSHPFPPAPPLVRTRRGRRTLEFAPGDIQSEMLLARPDALALAYQRAMMGFVLFRPRPRHIVMVGLGGGSLAKFCHRHFPGARITVIELRADVIALRDAFHVPPDSDRFTVVHADACDWLAAHPATADVLLADGFDARGLPPCLANAPFYTDCRRALRPGGVLVANVFTYDPRYPDVMDALDTVFDGHTCWFDKVAGNNRIVYAVHAPDAAVARRVARYARRRGLGPGLLNRLAIRFILARIASRSVLAPPHLRPVRIRL